MLTSCHSIATKFVFIQYFTNIFLVKKYSEEHFKAEFRGPIVSLRLGGSISMIEVSHNCNHKISKLSKTMMVVIAIHTLQIRIIIFKTKMSRHRYSGY